MSGIMEYWSRKRNTGMVEYWKRIRDRKLLFLFAPIIPSFPLTFVLGHSVVTPVLKEVKQW